MYNPAKEDHIHTFMNMKMLINIDINTSKTIHIRIIKQEDISINTSIFITTNTTMTTVIVQTTPRVISTVIQVTMFTNISNMFQRTATKVTKTMKEEDLDPLGDIPVREDIPMMAKQRTTTSKVLKTTSVIVGKSLKEQRNRL